MADTTNLTDRERRKLISDLLEDTHRDIERERRQDISWSAWSEEIGLGTSISLSQYRYGSRLPTGRNMIALVRWFRKERGLDLYEYLGYPVGGQNDPRMEYIYNVLESADEDAIRKIMNALMGNGGKGGNGEAHSPKKA
jgi:hypothetical protein